ncbi:PASTA domain-containing protein [Micromonospora sp. CV4]|uniref:PASTA domain-containing protein n=1 Tax=Micromonospora sp. CV4 TaxID=2478711 RepID=UPI000EF46FFE|nr:PASTA domain-containing protein [Micromonospora sp. CV4]RLP90985.1 PASTA domain-containing protein [Micromonospora sp. CV4]
MSDDRQEPPAGEHDDDRTRPLPPTAGRPEPSPPTGPATPTAASPDETMPIDRAASPDETAPMDRAASPDETAPMDRAASGPTASPDQTAPMDRAASGPAASPDQTMPIDRSAQTQPGAPVDRTARMPAERATPAPWSGRAEVRAARPAEPSGEWYAEEQGGRRWWLPILWGVLALLLAGLLGAALWVALAAQNDDRDDDPGPTPSLPPPSATSAAPTSAAPTSAAPTSETPSSPAATSAPAEVPVPPLTGLPQATAEGLLDRLGLSYRVVYRPSELPPGTVVGTEPDAGTSVPTDEEVLLIVSEAQPSTGASTAGPSPTVTPTQ